MSEAAPSDPTGLIDAVDLPIVVLDRDATVVQCNAAASTFLSLTPRDVGRSLRDIGALDGLVADIEELWEHVMAGGAASQREVRTKNGSWFVVRTTAYRGANRLIAGAVVTFTNVTGLRAGVEQSIYEREYTKTILNTVVDPLVVVDADLRIQTANRAFHAFFRVSRQEAQGITLYELGRGEWNTSELRARLGQCLSGSDEPTEAFEVQLDLAAVGRRTLSLIARRLPRDPRQRELILLGIEDITDRVQAETDLRQRTAQLEILVNEAPMGMFVVDADFRIRTVNPQALPHFAGAAEVVGRDFHEIMRILRPRPYADEVAARFRCTLETGEPHYVEETSAARRDGGGTDYFEWQTNRIPLPGGRHGVVCYFRDISAVVSTRDALRAADRRKDEFLATLAHELRNPLSPVRVAIALMRRTLGSSPNDRYLDVIERQVTNLEHIVDDLLEISRITRGKIELRKERLDLSVAVSTALETTQALVTEREHQVSVALCEHPVFVEADPVRIEQVLTNLLTNAAKYTEPGGRIWIAVERVGEYAEVRIRDTGIGIPEELMPRVFEIFEQGQRDLARSSGGLGIGLSIVKTLTELHGGTVGATSPGQGKGSEFVVRLPRAPEAQAVDLAGARATSVAGSEMSRRRILVVDDNADAGELFAELLRELGHDVRTARDGPTAIHVAGDWRADVVFLDIGLPGMDGYAVAREIRRLKIDTQLVALTGYGHESARSMSREAGFTQHLVKPPALEEVLGVLRGVVAAGAPS